MNVYNKLLGAGFLYMFLYSILYTVFFYLHCKCTSKLVFLPARIPQIMQIPILPHRSMKNGGGSELVRDK